MHRQDRLDASMAAEEMSQVTGDPFFELNPEILEDSLKSKGAHVSLCRWFSWVSAAREQMQQWWPRLTALVVAGLETKLFETNNDFLAFRSSPPLLKNQLEFENLLTKSEVQDKSNTEHCRVDTTQDGIMPNSRVHTTQYQDPDVKEIRKASKNTLHACCRVMADDVTYGKCMFIMLASIPFHDEHGRLTKTIADGQEATLALYTSWSFGSWLPTVRQCCTTLTNLQSLSRCNLTVQPLTELDESSSFALAKFEDYQVRQMHQFVVSLMSNRIQSMLWHTDNVPGILASLCDDNADLKSQGLQRVSDIICNIRAAHACKIPFVSNRAAKSMLHSTVVHELVAGLGDFSMVPDSIAKRIKFIFSGYGSSEIIEKLFRFLRVEVKPRSCSHKVAQEKVLCQTYGKLCYEQPGPWNQCCSGASTSFIMFHFDSIDRLHFSTSKARVSQQIPRTRDSPPMLALTNTTEDCCRTWGYSTV